MKKKAIIFDMDGVIFDTERIYRDIWMTVYKKHNFEMNHDIYRTFIGKSKQTIIGMLKERYGQNFIAEDLFVELEAELKKEIDNGQVPVKKGAVEIFDYLKKNNFKMAIATSSPRTKLDMQLKIHNLEKIFDAIICADDVTKSKPDPEIFLVAAKKLDVLPQECVVIEDSPAGIKAAYDGNITAIHVEDLVKPNEEICKCSVVQLKNLIEAKRYIEDNYVK